MTTSTDIDRQECAHQVRTRGRIGVLACPDCGLLEFFGSEGRLDPAEGVAGLFGNYDLVAQMPAVGAPGTRVLAYRPHLAGRGALELLPTGCWLQAGPRLWIASDGAALLLATSDDLLVSNLTRGA